VAIKALATQLGYAKIIEESGAVLTQDICTVLSIPEALGFKTLATNSPKMAFYAPGGNKLMTWYGNIQKCVNAAVKGYWES
jgi:predicted aconitase